MVFKREKEVMGLITSIPTLAKRWLDQGSIVCKASLTPIT